MGNKMELLAKELYEWCIKNNLWGDNILYFNNKAWASIDEWCNDKGKQIGYRLYEYEYRNPRVYFSGGNSAFACSFEGALNHVLNGHTSGYIKLYNQFNGMFEKYGLTFIMNNSWNGNAYKLKSRHI